MPGYLADERSTGTKSRSQGVMAFAVGYPYPINVVASVSGHDVARLEAWASSIAEHLVREAWLASDLK